MLQDGSNIVIQAKNVIWGSPRHELYVNSRVRFRVRRVNFRTEAFDLTHDTAMPYSFDKAKRAFLLDFPLMPVTRNYFFQETIKAW